jgi:hypothetical protein
MSKAIQVLTIQGDAYRRGSQEGSFALGEEIIMDAARKRIVSTLEKYISFKEIDHTLYVERFFFFDHEKYKKDLEVFGVEMQTRR